MAGTLSKIPKLHADMTQAVDPSWETVGVGPGGRIIYREQSRRARAVKDIDPKTGEQKQRKHGVTGEALYGLNKPELYTLERTFYLESDGQGNIYKVDYIPPTPEQIEAERRKQAAKDMMPALAEALVAEGLTAEEIVARLRGPATTRASTVDDSVQSSVAESPTGDTTEPEKEYPVLSSPGRWELSNGEIFAGKKVEAQAREAELQAALADAVVNAALTPDY